MIYVGINKTIWIFTVVEDLFNINSLRNSGGKYVGNKMPKQFQNFSVCLGNTPAKKTAEDYLCILRWQWLRHTSVFCQELWFHF